MVCNCGRASCLKCKGSPPPYTPVAPVQKALENFRLELDTDSPTGSGVHKIVVGVDFGTTYTGVSWVSTEGTHTKTLDDVHCIRDWPGPGREGDYSWKTPSRIAYSDENKARTNAWGFEVLPRMKSYSWMKLLLDPEQATKYDDPSLSKSEGGGVLAKPSWKAPVDLCADYLAEVAAFAYQSLVKRMTAEVLAATPMEFWFTVPAVWSDKAKSDTFRAARRAAKKAEVKFHKESKLFLIREPEAAAISTISALTRGGSQQQVNIGDSILICDCGGGTVDVTTYEITGIAPKLEFKELLVGIGGKCGSTYIDREFIKWMEIRFGNAYKTLSWEKKGPASRFMKDFESHKRDFGKSKDPGRYYEMQLLMKEAEDSVYYDEDSGIVRIYDVDLEQLFKPVVTKILGLLSSQLEAERKQKGKVTIKTIILVGGFGDSFYLNDCVRQWCQENDGIRLICPEHPQAAIVRGAALSGLLNIQPSSRRSRRHYGFSLPQPYDSVRHRREDKFIWRWDGTEWASGNMEWQLAKGDLVDKNTIISQPICYTFENNRVIETKSVKIYCCDMDDPPDHVNSKGVRKLGEFEVDFTGVNINDFPSKTRDGAYLQQVTCQYRIHFGERRGVLCFSCLVNGKDIGNTTVTFEGQDKQDLNNGHKGTEAPSPTCAVQ